MALQRFGSTVTEDAIGIWQAGVSAVRADRVVRDQVSGEGRTLCIEADEWLLDPRGQLIIVGAGKATFKMAQGLMAALDGLDPSIQRVGWINVPEGTVDGPIDPRIRVCEARPLGANEPTPLVVQGTQAIVEMLASAKPEDFVICLFSGGGSALLCAPMKGVTLEDKLTVTRLLSQRGATIEQLNLVRSSLSLVKRGGLARLTRARRMATLLLSDVLGDPIETIASGPTYLDHPIDIVEAGHTLRRLVPQMQQLPESIWNAITRRGLYGQTDQPSDRDLKLDLKHYVLANNATAVDASGVEAVRRGYAYYMESSPRSEGPAEAVGRALARQCIELAEHPRIQCLIMGGEPSVILPADGAAGRGGRNQHVVLAAMDELQRQGVQATMLDKIVILSGGTDGEDGPTDAAGAWLDAGVYQQAMKMNLDSEDYLRRCDSYNFFRLTNSLLKTGPTQTNVCDIRVAIFDSRKSP